MTFTPEDVKRVTQQLLEEKGADYVYPYAGSTCVYAENGAPSCLLGHIAARLEPGLFDKLKTVDVDGWVDDEDGGVTGAEDLFAVALGEDDVYKSGHEDWSTTMTHALFRAQAAQDSGKPWGEAARFILQED